MAAYTASSVTYIGNGKDEYLGDRKVRRFKLALAASYATNGDALPASALNLNVLESLKLSEVTSDGATLVVWDDVNGKVKCFSALGTQVTNATDLHTKTVFGEAIGW